jgi:hypothetical protein
MGASPHGFPGTLMAPIMRPATSRFARLMAAFDDDVGRLGTQAAARNLLPHLVSSCWQSGAEQIPKTGPLLVASNHPGAMDSMVILASIARPDVKFVVSDVPVLHAFPNCSKRALYASTEMSDRLSTVRQMMQHLHDGGTVVIFPGGHLDPDPAILPGAADRLAAWSRSLALLMRRVPDTTLIATIVEGVLSPRMVKHPLTRLAPPGWERLKLAEMLQVAQQLVFGVRFELQPRVTFGAPVKQEGLMTLGVTANLQEAIVRHAESVLEQHLVAQTPPLEIHIPA